MQFTVFAKFSHILQEIFMSGMEDPQVETLTIQK